MSKIKPTENQLKFLDWEIGAFFHFGIRTFNEGHKDWDMKDMPLSTFNPTELDCEQWIKSVSEMGAKYAILVTKHHDGFANWPTKYSDYNVSGTPWKDGKGDVVREFTDACRKYGVHVGLYYSPAQFGYTEMSGKEYDDYFINQISELLTNYGKIEYLWFDGNGSEDHEYDKDRIVKCIRSLQPEIMIFNMWDPDTLWVGNEEGIAPFDARYEVTGTKISTETQDPQLLDCVKFLPYECDCKLRRYNWFYSEFDLPDMRSLNELVALYDYSVGRGGNLLLNIAPDRRGLLPDEDVERIKEFGKAIKDRFSVEKNVNIEYIDDGFIIKANENTTITTIEIMEDLVEGQGILGFQLIYSPCGGTVIYEGKTVGHKQIVTIPELYLDDSRTLTFKVTESNDGYKINSVRVF